MTKILAISEANTIAFHAMALIAKSKTSINAIKIAEITNSSRHHTSKVLQRLVKEGLLGSTRGPTGGFFLKKPANEIKLIEILEAIEGKVTVKRCPIDNPICPFGTCLMGDICHDISETMLNYLKENDLQYIVENVNPDKDKNLF
ncbi:MAG: Rrf2 family transcriptional regulator [Bacteroidales bacterium]|nr:Rrf2 family transcriptional regulator [Bacteroidales bacterium]MDD4217753.1 Rrf2 family transcriptional regulator [Bacteroidales bacterium]MDY0142170.1 Rrf2 family transcriptional regulator [Bacteroidales bacterium]